MKRLFVASLLLIAPLAAREPAHGFGFAAGQVSGVGFSYRYLPQDYGVQISFGVLSTKDDYSYQPTTHRSFYDPDYPPKGIDPYPYTISRRDTDANIGLMFIKVLHTAKRSRFYAFTGFSIFYQIAKYKERYFGYHIIDEKTYEYGPIGDERERTERSSTHYGGLGIGIEFKVTENIRLALEWPLSYSSRGDLIMYIPQAGLHYFFN